MTVVAVVSTPKGRLLQSLSLPWLNRPTPVHPPCPRHGTPTLPPLNLGPTLLCLSLPHPKVCCHLESPDASGLLPPTPLPALPPFLLPNAVYWSGRLQSISF
eukprot:Sspe_Gene.57795::Locus_31711_Transcript_1_1_Confidence_1.000_Length_848::g.57795::m.57795